MKKTLLLLFALLTITGWSQEFFLVDSAYMQSLEPGSFEYVNISVDDQLVIEKKSNVLIDLSMSDIPLEKVDSVLVSYGDPVFAMRKFSPFMIKDVEGSEAIMIRAFGNGKQLNFPGTNTDELSVKLEFKKRPVFVEDMVVFGILAIVLALIFYTAHLDKPGWKKFYTWVPALLLCYLIPALLDQFGLISNEYTGLYTMAKNYLLPGALILMTIGIDFKGIINLGPKALIMFFTATIGIILGGPFAIWIYSMIDPEVVGGVGNEAAWRGFATLAGSWIGGGANQTAMYELYGYKQALYGKMITVDIVVAQLWMIFLLWGAARSEVFDRWLKADTSAIDDLKKRMQDYEKQHAKKATLTDYMVIAGLTFGLVGFSHLASFYLAPYFEETLGSESPFASKFFWLVVLTTIGGIVYSLTKAKTYEGAGASRIGSFFIYILVATIGMKMDLGKALEEPQLILVGAIWMLFHIALLFLVAKWIKAPFFFVAVGSKANVGGAASAPVVASAFHPSLASVGALLAVLGYAIGSIGAIVCAEMMSAVAP